MLLSRSSALSPPCRCPSRRLRILEPPCGWSPREPCLQGPSRKRMPGWHAQGRCEAGAWNTDPVAGAALGELTSVGRRQSSQKRTRQCTKGELKSEMRAIPVPDGAESCAGSGGLRRTQGDEPFHSGWGDAGDARARQPAGWGWGWGWGRGARGHKEGTSALKGDATWKPDLGAAAGRPD